MIDGRFELSDIKVTPLSKVYNLNDFNCGDQDLDEFLKNDSFGYQKNELANVYLVIFNDRVIGFFSLQNDAVKLELEEKDKAAIEKPHIEYPAAKIGRLGIDKTFQGKGAWAN